MTNLFSHDMLVFKCQECNYLCMEWNLSIMDTLGLGMGDIGTFIYDNCHQKYHGYCKYHDIK